MRLIAGLPSAGMLQGRNIYRANAGRHGAADGAEAGVPGLAAGRSAGLRAMKAVVAGSDRFEPAMCALRQCDSNGVIRKNFATSDDDGHHARLAHQRA